MIGRFAKHLKLIKEELRICHIDTPISQFCRRGIVVQIALQSLYSNSILQSSKMANVKMLIIRVTKNQFERIKINTQAKGFKTISGYIRSLALDKDMVFEKKFDQIYRTIVHDIGVPKKTAIKEDSILAEQAQ